MTVSGFTFIRNGISFDYPFRESITSLLPLVHELVVAVGNSDDGTRQAVEAIPSNKIRIVDTVWDDSLRTGGRILAQQTNIAFDQISGDWGLYLQGDEVLHEDDIDMLHTALQHYSQRLDIEGLLFDYIHFYGSYGTIGDSRKWYRREVRAVRPGSGIRSWGDAQGFRKGSKKLRVARIPVRIFHYGWVKPPESQTRKLSNFHKLWHSDEWVKQHIAEEIPYQYADGGRLRRFEGTHPKTMAKRVREADWTFDAEISNRNVPMKDKLLTSLEDITGWRPGEYRNYILKETFNASL